MVKTKRKKSGELFLAVPHGICRGQCFHSPCSDGWGCAAKGVSRGNRWLRGHGDKFLSRLRICLSGDFQRSTEEGGFERLFFLKCMFCNVTWKFSRLSKRESIPEQQVRCASTSYVSFSDDWKRSHSKTRVIALCKCKWREFNPLLNFVLYLIHTKCNNILNKLKFDKYKWLA